MTTLIQDNFNSKLIIENDVIEIINNLILIDSRSAGYDDINNITLKHKTYHKQIINISN